MPKTCVLCGKHPASRKGEHTQPQWYLQPFHAILGEYTTYEGGEPARKPDGTPRPSQVSFPRTKLPVCDVDCNPRLNRRFEEPAKPIVRGLWGGRLSLTPSEADDFALWVLKTWLLTAHPRVEVSDPGWKAALKRWDLGALPKDIYGWTVTSQPPPDGLSVWATKTLGQDGSPTYRIPLPTIVADGRTTKFQVFAHGMDFLDAGFLDIELVYHPGWEIEHPLEADSRATRLWPRDLSAGLDIGALPPVSHREVSWYEGPCLHFEPGAFQSVARPPLSAATDPEFLLMPPGVWKVTRG